MTLKRPNEEYFQKSLANSDTNFNFAAASSEIQFLTDGVTVAQQILVLFVKVRILVGQQ